MTIRSGLGAKWALGKSLHLVSRNGAAVHELFELARSLPAFRMPQRGGTRSLHFFADRCDPEDDAVCAERDPVDVAQHVKLAAGVLTDTEHCQRLREGPGLGVLVGAIYYLRRMDEAERERFQGIPTALQLSPEIVNSVIEVAPKLINDIPDFHRLVRDLSNSTE